MPEEKNEYFLKYALQFLESKKWNIRPLQEIKDKIGTFAYAFPGHVVVARDYAKDNYVVSIHSKLIEYAIMDNRLVLMYVHSDRKLHTLDPTLIKASAKFENDRLGQSMMNFYLAEAKQANGLYGLPTS